MGLDTYEAALNYLFGATDYEKMQRVRYNADTFSLDRMGALLGALGSPERRFRSVHVAGTKGKGSTAAILHALALEGGLRAGLYTSPHLVDIRERIRVGREDIPAEALRALVADAQPHVDRMRAAGDPPTFFEIFTALAFRHFADEAVDLAVVEVGLGGRLDATNVLRPDVSVVTSVSMDHTHQLGRTLESIAAEKAGIVKPGVPVVCQPQRPEAMAVVERAAQDARAPLTLVGRDVTYTWAPAERAGIRLAVRTPHAAYDDLFLPLLGEHQAVNAATAIAAAERAGPLAERLTPERVRGGLRRVHWPGRMELVPGRPDLLLDGAHNRASMERLMEGLAQHFPGRPRVFVFASAADKDVDGMLAVLAEKGGGAPVVFTRTDNPRAADPVDLADSFRARGGRGAETAVDTPAALEAARKRVARGGLVVVCGSLYLVGEVKALVSSSRVSPPAPAAEPPRRP
ncbi:MAG TPA: folylpolyglutamate synthase/dihydrofolate synthase family protein [Phycisphaerae bacterium]|nr:folylpolyglutamate synthase/dihydrofolate synthase family protein [Phycisphaerae bacterium]